MADFIARNSSSTWRGLLSHWCRSRTCDNFQGFVVDCSQGVPIEERRSNGQFDDVLFCYPNP